jgi:hypothetical protein
MSKDKVTPKNMRQCAENLEKLLRGNKKGRVALTRAYLYQETGRVKIEDSFIDNFNDFCADPANQFELALYRVQKKYFILFRTSLRFLDTDPGRELDDED